MSDEYAGDAQPNASSLNMVAGETSGDLLAGLTVWAVLVPEALAYATIAGVPVIVGLYAIPLALIAYAVLELVERIATPTPRLIGVDPTGEPGPAGIVGMRRARDHRRHAGRARFACDPAVLSGARRHGGVPR